MLFYCTDISRADAHPTELTLYILVIEYIKKYIFVNNKDERWLEKSYDRYAGSFSFEAKANVCLRNASGNGPA